MVQQVFSQANTPMKRWMLDFAFRRKESELKNGVVRTDSMWDKLIFKKVQVNTNISPKKHECPNPGAEEYCTASGHQQQVGQGDLENKQVSGPQGLDLTPLL